MAEGFVLTVLSVVAIEFSGQQVKVNCSCQMLV